MNYPMPIVPDDGEPSWSDSRSTESEENATMAVTSPRLWSNPGPMRRIDTGQLSPISNEIESPIIDRLPGSGDVPSMARSCTTSRTNSWSTAYSDATDSRAAPTFWDQDSDDVLTVPKLEPGEEDEFHMDDVAEAPPAADDATRLDAPLPTKTKRPRGRPRKHPLVPQSATDKLTKGRSKTGCITCRKRKKKCDEAKPRCMNCEKNAVVCEGYNAKTIWKSGKEKAEEEKRHRQSLSNITLQPIFRGVETPEDMVFLNHYIHQLSGVLTVESEHKNAFKDMLLQMAVEHPGLMHSILSLASTHIDYDTPYGRRILDTNPKISLSSLVERSEYHRSAAMENIQSNIAREVKNEPDQKVSLSLRYGQMLCLLLQTRAEGTCTGEHRVHLQAYKHLIQNSPPEDSAFLVFVTEFFQYHVFADELIRFPDMQRPRLAHADWTPWVPIQPARLIGVDDGLFFYLCQITSIRNDIRNNIAAHHDPVVDYSSLYRAAEIDEAIRDWNPNWPAGDSRDRVGLLYKQMMWVYLFRTIYPPSASSLLATVPGFLGTVPESSRTPATTNTDRSTNAPTTSIPTPTPSSTSSTVAAAATAVENNQQPATPPSSSRPTSSRGISPHTTIDTRTATATSTTCPSTRASSPAPIRYPPHHDHRITLAVDESLAIMESFKPSDPCQTLLLIPALVIGCAAFAPLQRERVRQVLRVVRGYTGMRNVSRVGELLEEVWRLMEGGHWGLVWDWQGVAKRMDLDFVCA